MRAGHTKTWEPFKVPDEAVSCGFTEAVRGVLSHHMVIKDGKIANYHPYPPTPWNASVRDEYGTPGPYEDAVQNTPIFEENPQENFKGIDIMRAVRSFDPCLPCGVHMYLGKGKALRPRALPARLRPARAESSAATPPGRGRGGAAAPSPTGRGLPMPGSREVQEAGARVEPLLGELSDAGRRATGPRTWSASLIELYGAGLARILDMVGNADGAHAGRGRPVGSGCWSCTTCTR